MIVYIYIWKVLRNLLWEILGELFRTYISYQEEPARMIPAGLVSALGTSSPSLGTVFRWVNRYKTDQASKDDKFCWFCPIVATFNQFTFPIFELFCKWIICRKFKTNFIEIVWLYQKKPKSGLAISQVNCQNKDNWFDHKNFNFLSINQKFWHFRPKCLNGSTLIN